MVNKIIYSTRQIYAILDSYTAVDAGAFDQDTSVSFNKKTKRDVMRAPFENSIVNKADLDAAIDKLGVPGRWLAYCKNIAADPAGHGLNPKQFAVAKVIQGWESYNISGVVKELAAIA